MSKENVRMLGLVCVYMGLIIILMGFYCVPHLAVIIYNPLGYKKLHEMAMMYLAVGELLSFLGFILIWTGRDKTY